jgi:hypothetical protein
MTVAQTLLIIASRHARQTHTTVAEALLIARAFLFSEATIEEIQGSEEIQGIEEIQRKRQKTLS